MKKNKIGECHLCGIKKKLTFEHIPPKSAFNSKPIYVQKYNNLFDKNSYFYQKRIRSHAGLGAFTLCAECNNNTGSWYAKDFISFASQGMNILKEKEGKEIKTLIPFKVRIKPLNVVKQLITMFLSIDSTKSVLNIPKLQKFIQDKNSQEFPENIRIFMYCTLSPYKRLSGFSIGRFSNFEGTSKLSEINFQPFGYILGIDEVKPNLPYSEITPFLEYEYDEECNIEVHLPYLKVKTPFIGEYQNVSP